MNGEPTNTEPEVGPTEKAAQQACIERRRYPRYKYSIPVLVRVLVQEETFNPHRFAAHTRDISAGGTLLEIEALSETDYHSMIRGQRMARIHTQIPEVPGEVVFFGKIVWYDFRRTSLGNTCLCGIAFEDLSPRTQEVLADLLARLETADSSLS